jgi:hypothetical protein
MPMQLHHNDLSISMTHLSFEDFLHRDGIPRVNRLINKYQRLYTSTSDNNISTVESWLPAETKSYRSASSKVRVPVAVLFV